MGAGGSCIGEGANSGLGDSNFMLIFIANFVV